MTDFEIESFLNKINELEIYYFKEDFADNDDETKYRKAITYLQNELKLIRQPFSNSTVLELTPFGRRVIRKGGWIEYQRIESEKESRSDRKDVFDFKVSKFRYYTFWWFFAFSIMGSGLSIYNFIDNFSPSKQDSILEKRIKKVEFEIEKFNTTISKSLDTLDKPKVINP